MKIRSLRTYKFSVPTGQRIRDPATGELLCSTSKPWLFLELRTDVGISGWGEGTGEWLTEPVEAALHAWEELLVGRDPAAGAGPVRGRAGPPALEGRTGLRQRPGGGGTRPSTTSPGRPGGCPPIPSSAAGAGTGSACTPRPHWPRRRRPSPAPGRPWRPGTPASKGNPLETRSWPMDREAVEHSAACVQAMREAVGDGLDLLLDAHGSPTPELSLAFAEAVAPWRPLFLEEPVKAGSVEALLEVSRKSPVPVRRGGEALHPRRLPAPDPAPRLRLPAARRLPLLGHHRPGGDRPRRAGRADADGAPQRRRPPDPGRLAHRRRRDPELPDPGDEPYLVRWLRGVRRARLDHRRRPPPPLRCAGASASR